MPDVVASVPRLQLAAILPSRTLSRPAVSAARRVELEQRTVDRSHFATYPLPRWSVEGERGDAKVTRIHQQTTIAERMAAWRILFTKHTKPQ